MKFKGHIALLLASLFLVKFMAIEANGLNMLFSGSNITFVNPTCKTKNFPKQSSSSSFTALDHSDAVTITFSAQCTSQFRLELFPWEMSSSKSMTVIDEFLSSRLPYPYLDSASPPPRLV